MSGYVLTSFTMISNYFLKYFTIPSGQRRTQYAQSQHSHPQDCNDLQTVGRPVCGFGNNDSFGLL